MISYLKSAIRTYLERRLGVPRIKLAMERLARQGFSPPTIFDVGAYQGEYAQICLDIWPDSQILCFEPQAEAVDQLKQRLNDQVDVYPILLGSEKKRSVVLHEAETASSVLQEHIDQSHPTSEYTMKTVDSVVKADLGGQPPDLLKLDVQGYELEVLRGADTSLNQVQCILMEVNLLDIHQNVPLLAEITEWLRKRGFVAYDICGLTRRPLDDALWQADMIFVSKESTLRADKRWGK